MLKQVVHVVSTATQMGNGILINNRVSLLLLNFTDQLEGKQ
jgi:hypothetical protein